MIKRFLTNFTEVVALGTFKYWFHRVIPPCDSTACLRKSVSREPKSTPGTDSTPRHCSGRDAVRVWGNFYTVVETGMSAGEQCQGERRKTSNW